MGNELSIAVWVEQRTIQARVWELVEGQWNRPRELARYSTPASSVVTTADLLLALHEAIDVAMDTNTLDEGLPTRVPLPSGLREEPNGSIPPPAGSVPPAP